MTTLFNKKNALCLSVLLAINFSALEAKAATCAACADKNGTIVVNAGKILVTNRTSGTLSVIDVATDTVVDTVSLALPGFRPPDPMYVSYVPKLERIFVDDRTNNSLTVLDANTFELLDSVPVGKGAFHMWADPNGTQLWSVNDIDKTISVFNPKTLDLIDTIAIPKELADLGGMPHDIALDNTGKMAFVTIIGVPKKGYVLRYDTKTRKLTHKVEVGEDPHISVAWKKTSLYVAAQGNGKVYSLNTKDLKQIGKTIDVPNAHGTAWTHKDTTFFTTNIGGKGIDGLQAIDVKTNKVIGKTDTGDADSKTIEDLPHNITISGDDSKLYIAHSGHDEGEVSGVVTVYDIRDPKKPKYLKTVNAGLNPFGITFMGNKTR